MATLTIEDTAEDLEHVDDETPVLNIPLARKVMEHIEAHEDEWDQGTYGQRTPCGTALCFAGHAVQLAGLTIDWQPPTFACDCGSCLSWQADTAGVFYASSVEETGRSVHSTAERLLGLTPDQAYSLFLGANEIDDLWDCLEKFSDGELTRP